MRPLISYDDITAPEAVPAHLSNPPAPQPPAKKRKTTAQNHRQGTEGGRSQTLHWDDPGSQGLQMSYGDAPAATSSTSTVNGHASTGYEDELEHHEEGEQESRELTHEEIWDDSALVDAWNSAAAEYEAFHGPGKGWKAQPVKKSPLWYNIPLASTSKPKAKLAPSQQNGKAAREPGVAPEEPEDSIPVNFDTFVPRHDPSLSSAAAAEPALTVPAMDGTSRIGAGAETAMVSQDEAFSKAMTAMYWSGYWTAVYHCHKNEAATRNLPVGENGEIAQEGIEEDVDDDEEMLPAQR